MKIDKALISVIDRQYEVNMALYPRKMGEVETYLQGREASFCLCMRYLYGHMAANDVLAFPVEMLADYVSATLAAYDAIDYVKAIPQEIFFPYVLYHRVNSECLDGSRSQLMAQIMPYVQGKTMTKAALAVNYWCYAQATYTPADDRTLGPLAVMRRAMGRCGEESVLAVAALRSAGIPARQVYCPRWSHCDDNHAWVEVWVDGDWHYLGACEPEAVLDKGWFTAAASRAMLVHTKQWLCLEAGSALQTTPIYQEISCTARYADLQTLRVQIVDGGVPQPGVPVAFQILNYSELFTLHRGYTDQNGLVCFETGRGDLCVYVYWGGKMLLRKVDMRQQEEPVVLDLAEGMESRMAMDLVPPAGKSDVVAQIKEESHEHRLRACEAHRAEKTAGFLSEQWAGNGHELQKFMGSASYTQAQKEEILQTLRPKDFVDITCQTLLDALESSNGARGLYPTEIFRDYILAPRIADEMLQPERAKIRALFPDGFRTPEEILAWMKQNMAITPDYGVNNYYPSAYGCLCYRQVPGLAFGMVFVALCRAFQFPARLAQDTGEGQWLSDGLWRTIVTKKEGAEVSLTLKNATDKLLHYQEHFTLGVWNGEDYVTLRYPALTLAAECTLVVKPGKYRLITTTRQIDGTASIALQHIQLDGDTIVSVELPADQTAERLKQVPLEVPCGTVKNALSALKGKSGMVIFAEPGSEPTEHLLQEMLECADGFNTGAYPVCIFVEKEETVCNATLQRVCAVLPKVQLQVCRDPEGEEALHRLMQVGDLRLPFAISVDANGRGVYASANYNIRTAQTHLHIQKLITGGI